MGKTIWDIFLALFERKSPGDDSDGESDGEEDVDSEDSSGFMPSPLDISVRVAHGGAEDEIERELSKIDEQAQNLDAERYD